MSKSVLVIDKPNSCDECDLCHLKEDGIENRLVTFCSATSSIIVGKDTISEDCPLVTLPEKRPCNYLTFEGYTNGYDKGWNDYRDTICKEGMVKHG